MFHVEQNLSVTSLFHVEQCAERLINASRPFDNKIIQINEYLDPHLVRGRIDLDPGCKAGPYHEPCFFFLFPGPELLFEKALPDISGTDSYLVGIKVFEERKRILSGGIEDIPELCHGHIRLFLKECSNA